MQMFLFVTSARAAPGVIVQANAPDLIKIFLLAEQSSFPSLRFFRVAI